MWSRIKNVDFQANNPKPLEKRLLHTHVLHMLFEVKLCTHANHSKVFFCPTRKRILQKPNDLCLYSRFFKLHCTVSSNARICSFVRFLAHSFSVIYTPRFFSASQFTARLPRSFVFMTDQLIACLFFFQLKTT